MILGVVAEQLLGSSDNPAFGTAQLDFVNGTYLVNGSPVSVEEIIADDGISDGRIVPGQGLEMVSSVLNGGTAPIIYVLGPLLDVILTASWTIVMEIENDGAGTGHLYYLRMWKGASFNTADEYFASGASGSDLVYGDETDFLTPQNRFVSSDYADSGSVHKFALTRTPSHLAVSQDGSVPSISVGSVDETDYAIEYENAYIADTQNASQHGWIRFLDIYQPLPDNDLSALTSLP